MSKKLNIASITNELEGSAFFPIKRQVSPPPTPIEQDHQEEKKKAASSYPVPPVRVVPFKYRFFCERKKGKKERQDAAIC